jgi:hypothetical protein
VSLNKIKSVQAKTIIILLIIAFILLHLPVFFNTGFNGPDAWRQSDVAAVARNFATESMNFFNPRIDLRGNLSGITGMEFPIFNYIVAIVYKITGIIWTGWGKLLSLICALSTIFVLKALLVKPRINELYKHQIILFFLVALCVPFYFRFSAKVMPEFLAMLSVIGSLYLFYLYKSGRKIIYLVLSSILLLMGMLIRPYYAVYGLPLLCDVVSCFYFRSKPSLFLVQKSFFYGFLGLLSGILILIVFALWYGYWVPYLNHHYGILDYFYMGDSVKQNFIAIFSSNLVPVVFKSIAKYYLGYILIPFVFYGIYVWIKLSILKNNNFLWDKNKVNFDYLNFTAINDISWIAILSIPIIILVSGKHFTSGSTFFYYLGAIYPAILIWVYIGVVSFYENCPRSIGFWVCFIIFLSLSIVSTVVANRQSSNQAALLQEKQVLLKSVKKDDLIVTITGGSPVNLYLLDRKGFVTSWPSSKASQDRLIKHYQPLGAKFILLSSDNKSDMIFKMKPL